MPEPRVISAAEALKAFAKQSITVSDFMRDKSGAPVVKRVKGEDGREREARGTETRALAESDIVRAVDRGDAIAIVTLDGKRYTAKKRGE